MWKDLSKKHPVVIENKFPLHYNKSINNSAHKKLIAPYFRILFGVSSLMYQGFKISNEIFLNLKNVKNICIYIWICVYVCVCVCVCVCLYIYIYIYMCICVYIWLCICMFVYIYIYIYIAFTNFDSNRRHMRHAI